jgi:hypothetical protein
MRAATQYPGGTAGCVSRLFSCDGGLPHGCGGSASAACFRGLLGVHCALRPAWPADSLTEPFLGVLQSNCHLLNRPKCFRLGRASPVGISTRGFNVPSQGTHNQYDYPLRCSRNSPHLPHVAPVRERLPLPHRPQPPTSLALPVLPLHSLCSRRTALQSTMSRFQIPIQ